MNSDYSEMAMNDAMINVFKDAGNALCDFAIAASYGRRVCD